MKLRYNANIIFDDVLSLHPLKVAVLSNTFTQEVMDEYGRLFEAAPDMLKALQSAYEYLSQSCYEDKQHWVEVEQAIQKATKGNLVTP